MNLLKKLFPKAYAKARFKLRPDAKHEVELVFTHEGVEYWKFVNEVNIPAERAFAAMDIYAEFAEKADRDYTMNAFKAIEEYLKKGENIRAGIVANAAVERMEHVTNVDLLYKLASVLYFDPNENVYSYDAEYNKKKIKAWRTCGDVHSFFLKTPLAEYLTSFNGSPENLKSYTLQQRKEALKMLQFQLASFSESEKKTDIFSKAKLLEETLIDLISLDN